MEGSARQRLESDLRTAMRAGDQTARDAIRYILAAVKYAEINRRGALTEVDEQAVLRRVGKQLADAIEQYRAGGREDLAAREEAQLAVLQRYLPSELSEGELAALVATVIEETGASGAKDMGRVMPVLIARAGGRADGRRLSAAAREGLARLG
jgi:uncharacterized protein YqeY